MRTRREVTKTRWEVTRTSELWGQPWSGKKTGRFGEISYLIFCWSITTSWEITTKHNRLCKQCSWPEKHFFVTDISAPVETHDSNINIFGYSIQDQNFKPVNFMLLIRRKYVFSCTHNKFIPSFLQLKILSMQRHLQQRHLAYKALLTRWLWPWNGNMERFIDWKLNLQYKWSLRSFYFYLFIPYIY